ncbi:helix-hairpin-helix domain-containing protein [Weeksellaceae bacterium TAE3-ERU29]|nr:helix-hairpin-helix domain-containing protein [Weeksellaceae bacterium TAE3-ERU29]
MRLKLTHFSVTKNQRNGFVLLCIILILVEVAIQVYPSFQKNKENNTEIPKEVLALTQEQKINKKKTNVKVIKPFNPNDLDLIGFQELGFTENQAKTILKFRKSLGGNFQSVEDFSKCYVISEKKFNELKPFIQLEINNSNKVENHRFNKENKYFKDQSELKYFDPNTLDAKGWENLGFSKKQALSILKYKNKVLKGAFKKPEDLQACYVVSDFMYNRLKPYMKIRKVKESQKASSIDNNILNVNKMNKEDWKKIGLSNAEAENILKFRDFIGDFSSDKNITECKIVDSVKLKRIKNKYILKFD